MLFMIRYRTTCKYALHYYCRGRCIHILSKCTEIYRDDHKCINTRVLIHEITTRHFKHSSWTTFVCRILYSLKLRPTTLQQILVSNSPNYSEFLPNSPVENHYSNNYDFRYTFVSVYSIYNRFRAVFVRRQLRHRSYMVSQISTSHARRRVIS